MMLPSSTSAQSLISPASSTSSPSTRSRNRRNTSAMPEVPPPSAIKSLYRKAQSHIPTAALSAPSWLRSYEDFVMKNATQVTQIESALRSISYIIPGRFRESELASESLHAFLLLLSHYHTTLFTPPPRPSPHTRYTRFWTHGSPTYARTSLLLRTIQYIELLCEMCAKQHSEKLRWRLIVGLEILKALCRFILLKITGSRMGVSPPVAEREIAPSHTSGRREREENEGEEKEWKMPRTGTHLPELPRANTPAILQFLSSRIITAEEIKSANKLIRRITSLHGHLAELTWIFRPVLYAFAMQRLQSQNKDNKRDWRPWALGLALELFARQLGKQDLKERRVGGFHGMTKLEREEWGKRGWSVAWWGLRGAFYENVTRKWVKGLAGKLKGKPLLDMVGEIVEDYDYLWDGYYFSTSTM